MSFFLLRGHPEKESDFHVRGCTCAQLDLWGNSLAHRNETAVRLGGGPRRENSGSSAGPFRPAENRRRGFWPKIRPTPPGGGPAGRTAGSFRYPPHPMCLLESKVPLLGALNNMTPAVAIDRLLCAPPRVGTAFWVYRLACGPLNNMTLAVAIDRLLCAPACVGTAFCGYRLACGPLNNMTPAVATRRLLCAPACVGTAFCVHRLACGPLNNMTPAVATSRLLCAPACVGTAFCVYRLACGPLNNMTPVVAIDRLLCAPCSVCTALPVAP